MKPNFEWGDPRAVVSRCADRLAGGILFLNVLCPCWLVVAPPSPIAARLPEQHKGKQRDEGNASLAASAFTLRLAAVMLVAEPVSHLWCAPGGLARRARRGPVVRPAPYRTCNEARADVFDSIEHFDNPTRRHSTIGYVSPVDFEKQVMQA